MPICWPQEADLVVVQAADVAAVHPHFAGRRFGNAGNQFEDRRFACARMAGDKNHLAFFNLETDVFQRLETTSVGFGNLFETYHGKTGLSIKNVGIIAENNRRPSESRSDGLEG